MAAFFLFFARSELLPQKDSISEVLKKYLNKIDLSFITDWNFVGCDHFPEAKAIIELNEKEMELLSYDFFTALRKRYFIADNELLIVKLPPGEFKIYRTIKITSFTVLIGDPLSKTKLFFLLKNPDENLIEISGYKDNKFSIAVQGTKKFSKEIALNQNRIFKDNDFVDIVDERAVAFTSTGPVSFSIGCVNQIEKILNDKIALKFPLLLDHSKFQTRVYKLIPAQFIGLKNLIIERSKKNGAGRGNNINIYCAVNCLIQNCEILNSSCRGINIELSSNISIVQNYIKDAVSHSGKHGQGYGIALLCRSSNCLIANNALFNLRHHIILYFSANRNAIAYNYTKSRIPKPTIFTGTVADISLHGNFAYNNLFEGNICEKITADDWHQYKFGSTDYLKTENGFYNMFINNKTAEKITLYSSDNALVVGNNIVDDEGFSFFGYSIYRSSKNVIKINFYDNEKILFTFSKEGNKNKSTKIIDLDSISFLSSYNKMKIMRGSEFVNFYQSFLQRK